MWEMIHITSFPEWTLPCAQLGEEKRIIDNHIPSPFPPANIKGIIKALEASASKTKGLFSLHDFGFTTYNVCNILHPIAQATCIADIDTLLGEFYHLSLLI